MHVPKSRALIPLGIAAAAAVLLAFGVITPSGFLGAAGVMLVTSTIVFIMAVVGPQKDEEGKQHTDGSF